MLKLWSICNRIIPKDWIDLITIVLKPDSQLQWRIWFKEEAKTIKQRSRARGSEISQDQLLGEVVYDTIERQSPYDGHTVALCCVAALNAWEKTEKVGKKFESFTKFIQKVFIPKVTFMDFLQRLTSTVNNT